MKSFEIPGIDVRGRTNALEHSVTADMVEQNRRVRLDSAFVTMGEAPCPTCKVPCQASAVVMHMSTGMVD